MGEAGVGKTHTCIAIVKKYLLDLKFFKVLYLIPKHKVAFCNFVKKKMKEEFGLDPENNGMFWHCKQHYTQNPYFANLI